MNITSSMIYFLLKKKHSMSAEHFHSIGQPVKLARLYNGRITEDGCLYIADCSQGIPVIKPGKFSLLFYKAEQRSIQSFSSKSNYAFVTDEVSGSELLESVFEIFQQLQEWDCALKDALSENMPLAEFMQLGQRVLTRPYNIVDRDLLLIYVSPNFYTGIKIDSNDIPKTMQPMPSALANELLFDDEYIRSTYQHTAFFHPSDDIEKTFFCINIFSGDHYLARLTTPILKSHDAYDPGDMSLFMFFSEYVKKAYQRYTSDARVRHQHDRMHNLLRNLVAGQGDSDNAAQIIADYGWVPGHQYSIIKLVFFEGSKMDASATYVCSQLEKDWPNSCALKLGYNIVWIVNHSLSPDTLDYKVFNQSLAYIIREYSCKAGVSEVFKGIDLVFTYSRQTEIALEVGESKDPHFWYYCFANYLVDYILNKITQDLTAEQLCHRGLLKLIEYDKKNNTEYVETLRKYIECRYNAAASAAKLFMHRTTLFRRIDRIHEISGIDLENPDELLHLHLSFKLIQ